MTRNLESLLCLMAITYIASGNEHHLHDDEYIKVNGLWYKICDDGTHAYSSDCGYVIPEPTCDNPSPQPDTSKPVCDFYACYCDSPTVRDPETKQCVPPHNCKKNN